MPSLTPVAHRLLAIPLCLVLLLGMAAAPAAAAAPFAETRFPAGYEAYHTYAEVEAELDRAVADHPGIVRKLSIGRSYEGRELWAAKISDNVARDEDEPEALFDALTHGREHLTVEMNLYLLKVLTDGYGVDPRITAIVDSREIYLVLMLNPDGGEFDIAGDEFAGWRRNRQPIPGTGQVGVDLNRNFGFKWGCCDGSSGKPRDETYRGWAPWVAPEVRAYRDFIRSRVVGGRQQLRVAISWHSSGELILWPYGYTPNLAVRTMTADDRATFTALGRRMAALNGYTAKESRELYTTDGDQTGWSHYEHRIFHFTVEMYPPEVDFYPRPEHIGAQTRRNREAVLYLLEHADCPYRATSLGDTRCGPLNENFEISRGWQVNPFGSDTARGGRFQRAVPQRTRDAQGTKQPAVAPSGERAVVTGAVAGATPTANDLDGGTTSLLSPYFTLAGTGWWLAFRSLVAHDARASQADFLRVSVIDGSGRTVVWSQAGRAANLNGAWHSRAVDLNAFAGRTVRLLFEAADGGLNNLFEAGIDDVRVYALPPGAGLSDKPARLHVRVVAPSVYAA